MAKHKGEQKSPFETNSPKPGRADANHNHETAATAKKNKNKLGPNAVAMKHQVPVKPNPFETVWSRRKFDILGKKRKGEERRVGLSRSRAIEKTNKKSKYNLSDGEEDDFEFQSRGALSERDDFEDDVLPADDDDGTETTQTKRRGREREREFMVMVEDAQDSESTLKEAHDTQSQIKSAMRSLFPYFKELSDFDPG